MSFYDRKRADGICQIIGDDYGEPYSVVKYRTIGAQKTFRMAHSEI